MANRITAHETAARCARNAHEELAALSGDVVGLSGATWQDIAGTLALNLRVIAGYLEQCREGRGAVDTRVPAILIGSEE